MTKILEDGPGGSLFIVWEMDKSSNYFTAGPEINREVVGGEYDDDLTNLTAIFQLAVEDCFHGFEDVWDPDFRLDILKAALQEFRLKYKYRGTVGPVHSAAEVQAIPVNLYNMSLREAFPEPGRGTRVGNKLGRIVADTQGVPWASIVLGHVLGLEEYEVKKTWKVGQITQRLSPNDFVHLYSQLLKLGCVQYAKADLAKLAGA